MSLDILPVTSVAQHLTLAPGRAHEFCGPARRVLALWAMAKGTTIWVRLRWGSDRLYPHGMAQWADPSGVIIVNAPRPSEVLACAEDALRSGACTLVVADLLEPPALTPLRRLHLACAEGLARRQTRDPAATLRALVLTPGMGGAAGVESRWHLAPCPPRAAPHDDPVQQAWTLRRLRARMAPPACWHVDANLCAHPLESEV
jgi:protein ImuA